MKKPTFNEYMKQFEDSGDKEVVCLDDGATYEQQWANAIDQALANAALDAFKESIKNNIRGVLEKSNPTDADLKWLQRRIETKIDFLDKIIHLSKTEEVPHDESEQHGERTDEGRKTSSN